MGKMMVDARLVVGGERDDERALRAQFDIDAGSLQQFRGERRPARLAFASERDQGILARLRLAAGGEHAGGGMAGAAARRAAVEHLDRCALGRQPPGNAKPDHPGADDGDLGRGFGRCAEACWNRVQEAAPFAGITQTGSWV